MGKFLIIKGVDFSQVSVEKVTFVNKIQITAKSSNVEYGTVTGSGGYYVGETVTLTAIPSSGCTFKQWNDGNTDATRTIIVGNADAEFIATFIQMGWNEINLSSYTNMHKLFMILNDGTDVPYALIPNLNNLDMYCIPVNEGDVFRILGNNANNAPIIIAVSQQYEIWDKNDTPYSGPNYNLGYAANTQGSYNEGLNAYRNVEFIVPFGATYIYVQSRNSENSKFISGYNLKVEKRML